jgi:hypothetical protein
LSSVLDGITGGNLVIDFAFSKTINIFLRKVKEGGERVTFNIYQNHFSEYDPAPKQTLSDNKKIGDYLSSGITLGSKTLFNDGSNHMIAGYIKNEDEELIVTTTTDLMECSKETVISTQLETPLQLMGTYFNEIRGYKGDSAYLILVDQTSNKAILYDKQSASKKTNDISKLNSVDINDIYTLIKSDTTRTSVNFFTDFKNKIKSILSARKASPSHAVAKYSGDTGQVLSCFLPLPNEIDVTDKQKLTGIITHDRLLLARALMSGVDIVIWHKEGPLSIFVRKDRKNPEVVKENYKSELSNLYYKEKCIEILLKPLILFIEKKLENIFTLINETIKEIVVEQPISSEKVKEFDNLYNKIFYIAHHLNPIFKSISSLIKALPEIDDDIMKEILVDDISKVAPTYDTMIESSADDIIEGEPADEIIEKNIILYKLIVSNKEREISIPSKKTNIFKRLFMRKSLTDKVIRIQAEQARETILSKLKKKMISIPEGINDLANLIIAKRRSLDLLSIQSLEIIHEFLFELNEDKFNTLNISKFAKKKITDKPLYYVSRGVGQRNKKKLNYDNCGFKEIIYLLETLYLFDNNSNKIEKNIINFRVNYISLIENIINVLNQFNGFNSNQDIVNVMKEVYKAYKYNSSIVMVGGRTPLSSNELLTIQSIFPNYNEDIKYTEHLIKSAPPIVREPKEDAKKNIIKSAPPIVREPKEDAKKDIIKDSISIFGKEYKPNENVCIDTLIINELITLQSEIFYLNDNVQKFLFESIPSLNNFVNNIDLWDNYLNYNGYVLNDTLIDLSTIKTGGKHKLHQQKGGQMEFYKDATFELNITNTKFFDDKNLEKLIFLILSLQDISGNDKEIKDFYYNCILNKEVLREETYTEMTDETDIEMTDETDIEMRAEKKTIDKFNNFISNYLLKLRDYISKLEKISIRENIIYQLEILNVFTQLIAIDYENYQVSYTKEESLRSSRDNRIIANYKYEIDKHIIWLKKRTNIFQEGGGGGGGSQFIFDTFTGFHDISGVNTNKDNEKIYSAYNIVLSRVQGILDITDISNIINTTLDYSDYKKTLELEEEIKKLQSPIEELKRKRDEPIIQVSKRQQRGGKYTIKNKRNRKNKKTLNKKKQYNKNRKTTKNVKKNKNKNKNIKRKTKKQKKQKNRKLF